jgi:hypothetical protein
MDNQTYNSIVGFIWGIADDCLRVVSKKLCKPPLSGKIKTDDGGFRLWQEKRTAN